MDEFMREIFGSAWAYYVAFAILGVWFAFERWGKRK